MVVSRLTAAMSYESVKKLSPGDDDGADVVLPERRAFYLGEREAAPLVAAGDVGKVVVEVVIGRVAARRLLDARGRGRSGQFRIRHLADSFGALACKV
jgi:hypothetical protein